MCESFILDSLDFTRCSLSFSRALSVSLSLPHSHSLIRSVTSFGFSPTSSSSFFRLLRRFNHLFFWPQIWTGYLLLFLLHLLIFLVLLLLHHLLFLLLLLFLFRLWLVSLPPIRGGNKNTGAGGRIEGRWWRSLSFHVFKSSLLEFFSAQLTLDFYRGESAFFPSTKRTRSDGKQKQKKKTIWLFKIYIVCVCACGFVWVHSMETANDRLNSSNTQLLLIHWFGSADSQRKNVK